MVMLTGTVSNIVLNFNNAYAPRNSTVHLVLLLIRQAMCLLQMSFIIIFKSSQILVNLLESGALQVLATANSIIQRVLLSTPPGMCLSLIMGTIVYKSLRLLVNSLESGGH